MFKYKKFTSMGCSARYKCKVPGCGALHGGSMSRDICPNCYGKGHR